MLQERSARLVVKTPIDRRAPARFGSGLLACVPETKNERRIGHSFCAFANATKPLNCGMEAL